MGEDPEYVASESPVRTAPRICEFSTEDGPSKYMIFIEQQGICETGTLTQYFYGSRHIMYFIYATIMLFQMFVFSFKSSFLDCHVLTHVHPHT